MQYDFQTLKEAILFNAKETLPTSPEQLDTELQNLIRNANQSGERIRHYIGFEISGQIHIGTGMSTALVVKQLQDAGVKVTLWLADYHTYLNNKLDGQLTTIRTVAREYFGPVMLECCKVAGCNVEDIDLLFAETEYDRINLKLNNQNVLTALLKTSNQLTLNRVMKSISVTGKEAGEGVNFGTLIYPALQTMDAFWLQTHIVHAGVDQRKCHVLMREVALNMDDETALKIGKEKIKPIALHHNLLHGLLAPTTDTDGQLEIAKMSKSKPDSAIWVHDSLVEITRKLKKAYCPMQNLDLTTEENLRIQEFNPILNWCKNMIYPAGLNIEVTRPEKFGGNKTYTNYKELESDYMNNSLHPMDLKNAVATCLANWLSPIREYTENNPNGLKTLLEVMTKKVK